MRSSRWWLVIPVVTLMLAPGARRASGAEGEAIVHIAGGVRPPVLEGLDEPGTNLLAIAINTDGTRAAMAVELSTRPQRSALRLHEVGGRAPRIVELAGRLRDLLFSSDGSVVYVLQHKSAKKREGDTFLLTVDWASTKTRRALRVPASAAGLDHWAAGSSLLVAARNEIRTVLLPDLRSGPLFRIPGENASVASLGGDRILVGQDAGLLLIDLGAPPGRDAMPVVERTDAPAPVVSLAAEPGGRGALARLADGRLFSVALTPLTLREQPAPARDVTAPPRSVELPPPLRKIEPEPVEAPVEAEPAPVVPEQPRPARVEPAPGPEARHQIQGRIEGPAASRVEHVVLFGPDNILREAARVRPDPAGRWFSDGLDPGRYRIQVDGGGGAVLVTEPRFLLLTVPSGESVQAPVLKILRTL